MLSAQRQLINDEDNTVIASNVSSPSTQSFKSCAFRHFLTSSNYGSNAPNFAGALLALKSSKAIADSGATQINYNGRHPSD
jgi:hypothetical protein